MSRLLCMLLVVSCVLAGSGCCAPGACRSGDCFMPFPLEEEAKAPRPPHSKFHPVPTRPVFAPPGRDIVEAAAAAPPRIAPPRNPVAPPVVPPQTLPEPAPMMEKPKPLVPPSPEGTNDTPAAPVRNPNDDPFNTGTKPAHDDPPPAPNPSGSTRAPELNAPEVASRPARRLSALLPVGDPPVEGWRARIR